MKRMNRWNILVLILTVLGLSCASTNVYKEVMKDEPTYNSQEFSSSPGLVYEAVMRTLFDKKFVIEREEKGEGTIVAKRYFKKGKRTIILLVQTKILGVAEGSLVYLNAVQTTERMYVADRTRFFLFLIPLPGGGGKQASTVKEGEKIVEDEKFYDSLFSKIRDHLENLPDISESEPMVAEFMPMPPSDRVCAFPVNAVMPSLDPQP